MWLMKKDSAGHAIHVNRWPDWLDLENALYHPLVHAAVRIGYLIAIPFDVLFEKAYVVVSAVLTFCRACWK